LILPKKYFNPVNKKMPRNKSLLKTGHSSKKIVIKPFSKPPALPPNYYETTSREILQGTLSLLETKHPSLSLQHSYQAVVHLVSHQYGPRLYADLRASMQVAARLVFPSESQHPHKLTYVPAQYQLYLEYLLLCKHVFLPLDRTHYWQPLSESAIVARGQAAPTLLTVWQVGLEQLAARLQELHLDAELYQEWIKALIDDWSSSSSQSSGATDRHDLQSVWYLWQDLGLLQGLPLQRDLEEYWTSIGTRWADESPYRAAAFLQFAHAKHLHVTCWPWLPSQWLWSILEQCLIQSHLTAEYLLKPEHLYPILTEELASVSPGTAAQQLWMLAGRIINGQQLVAQSICKFARDQGLLRVQRKFTNPTQVISEVLELQDALTKLIASLPHGSDLIHLKNTWEEVANYDISPPLAESLAKFMDQILRSTKKIDEFQSKSENWLLRIVAGLFVPIQAKDVFEAFYKRDLAKRLLWNRVVNMDIEKQVCSLLKAECGAGYTSKMEGMFQDVDWSRETMNVYKQSSAGAVQGPIEMEVQVLTTGYWPVYPQYPNLLLPETLQDPQDRFSNHYKTKYQGRRVTWQYALGHCVVRANGFNKTYELIVSLCQALVLAQFTSIETRWSISGIMLAIGLEDRDEMERLLLSLSVGKDGTRILKKIDFDRDGKKKIRSATVDDKDEFVINASFDSNQRRIRINNIMMKETREEHEKTVEAISRDRLYLIDAVLVRIMKARKTILHQSLIAQVIEQMKLPVQPADVKMRIESLIEREYLERDAKERNRYNYLA
jgi:cullin-4